MPELPEVEALRRAFASRGLEREVADVDVTDADVLHGTSQTDFAGAVRGTSFSSVKRHGKTLFARAGDGLWLVMHFGMTGDLVFCGPDEAPPDHARFVFTFGDGGRLAFDNPRKFGWLELADDIEGYLEDNDVGPDALSLSEQDFRDIVGGTRGRVKPALMDQSKLAGIGNVYSDEILFRARIRPDAKASDLSGEQLGALHQATLDVLGTASDRLSDGKALPSDWLAAHRDEGESCPRCGGTLLHMKIGGRTSWFCPGCQEPADG
jgi:formamidopyrimidine-DNA glycosylase